jgi:hypothetical protein
MLTEQQLATLKADIQADPAFAGYGVTIWAEEVAAAYNLPASPEWTVWRTSVDAETWDDAILGTMGAATQLDGLTASKRDSLFWALSKTLNPSNPATRAALDDFCGSQNTLKAAVQAAQKRTSTRAEKLFSSGTGSTAAPATMTFEGKLTYQDVEAALALA